MNVGLTITTNSKNVLDAFQAFITRQYPYSVAKSLTTLAKNIKEEELKRIPDLFEVRTSWPLKTIKIIPARKEDWPGCYSVVGVRDKVMALNITGGENTSTNIAVPGSPEVRVSLNPAKRTLGPAYFPARLLGKGGKPKKLKAYGNNRPFITQFNSGFNAVVVRTGKARLPVKVLYAFPHQTKTYRRWRLDENASITVRTKYEKILAGAIAEAIRTSKRY